MSIIIIPQNKLYQFILENYMAIPVTYIIYPARILLYLFMPRFFCFIFILISISGYPQSKVDSLKTVLSQTEVDTTKVKVLIELHNEYRKHSPSLAEQTILEAIIISDETHQNKFLLRSYILYSSFLLTQSKEDSAIVVLNKSLEIAENNNYSKQQSDVLVNIGYAYWQKGDFEKAAQYQQVNLEVARSIGDSMRVANSYLGLGSIFSQKGEYTQAMEYYTLASKRFLGSENLSGYRVAIGNIGYIQRSLGNYSSAIEYFKRSDSISVIQDNIAGQAFSRYNLSVVYKNMGQLDSALVYNRRGLELYEQIGIKKRVSYCYFTLGEIHRKKEDFKEALDAYQQSLGISIAVDDSVQIGYSSMAVADMYDALGNSVQSINYLDNAANVAQRMQLDILAMDIHERLAERQAKSGDLKNAYDNLQKFIVLKDSLYTKEKRELGSEIEAKYQNEQKTKEIALLASEKELQTLQLNKRENERNAIIGFAILTLLLAVLFYNQYRIKQRSNKELQALDQLKSNFFANISHEFRTPLTLIKGPIEHLEQNPDEILGREDIKMIRRNTNKVLNLVNQLLDLSRISQGKLQLKPTEGDIFKCLRIATASFNSHAAQNNMDYRVEIPDGILWAAFDRDKLEQIIYNLLSNAFKFSEQNESVALEASYIAGELKIQVSDTGIGIPTEKLPFIFDRFYQVDGSITKDKEGSGIGLSLTKDLVELMDGTITVSSEEGKGTFFTIQLPIEKIETHQESNYVKTKSERNIPINNTEKPLTFEWSNADNRNVPKVLLVEDNADMRQFIKAQLIRDYQVVEAKNGEQGLKIASTTIPDLIVSDLMMPKMDGIQLCAKLKTSVETSHIPVIMLTARAGIENKIEGLETGADDYLTKPFDAKELYARVKNLILQRQRLREHYKTDQQKLDPEKITVTSLDKKFLEKVLALLEKNHTDADYGVPQMQQDLAMSKTQLHRKLKALTNESPGELLRNFRLKRAAQLLSQKTDTVTQVAYQVGFNNLSYFAKCFKEQYGVAPSSF